jgi:hypothetical protein
MGIIDDGGVDCVFGGPEVGSWMTLVAGRLIVPCSSRRARPDGVCSSSGRGFVNGGDEEEGDEDGGWRGTIVWVDAADIVAVNTYRR